MIDILPNNYIYCTISNYVYGIIEMIKNNQNKDISKSLKFKFGIPQNDTIDFNSPSISELVKEVFYCYVFVDPVITDIIEFNNLADGYYISENEKKKVPYYKYIFAFGNSEETEYVMLVDPEDKKARNKLQNFMKKILNTKENLKIVVEENEEMIY